MTCSLLTHLMHLMVPQVALRPQVISPLVEAQVDAQVGSQVARRPGLQMRPKAVGCDALHMRVSAVLALPMVQ